MKLGKLTNRLGDLLSADRRHQREKRNKLKELLKLMKKQQKALEHELKQELDTEKRAGVELKLQILIEQRKKGVRLLRELSGKS